MPTNRESSSGKRSQVVDIVKGIAIVLVVFGHVAQGAAHRALWTGRSYFIVDHFIYAFHMPAFFIVAGLFLDSSLKKRGLASFTASKVGTVLYPYLLWATPTLLASKFAGNADSAGASNSLAAAALSIATGDVGWFLYALFLALVLGAVLRPLPVTARLILASLLSLFWPTTRLSGLDRAMHELVFVVIGQAVVGQIGEFRPPNKWSPAVCSVFCFGLVLAVVAQWGGTSNQATLLYLSMPLGLVGSTGLFLIGNILELSRLSKSIAYLGEASLAIFLMHPFFQGATRLLLARLPFSNPVWVQMAVPAATAVAFPALLWHYRTALRLSWLFSAPASKLLSPTAPLSGMDSPAKQPT